MIQLNGAGHALVAINPALAQQRPYLEVAHVFGQFVTGFDIGNQERPNPVFDLLLGDIRSL